MFKFTNSAFYNIFHPYPNFIKEYLHLTIKAASPVLAQNQNRFWAWHWGRVACCREAAV